MAAARELGVTVYAYSPLGRGLLTGKYVRPVNRPKLTSHPDSQRSPDDFEEGDIRRVIPRYSKENFPNVLKVVEEIQQIGKRHDASAGQVTLAWLLAQGPDIIPIPGTRNVTVRKKSTSPLWVDV